MIHMRSHRSSLRPRVIWLSVILVSAVAVLILADTERRYMNVLQDLDEVQTNLAWERTEIAPDEAKINVRFQAQVRNESDFPLAVETVDTQLHIDGQYAGAYSITDDDDRLLEPQTETSLPLDVVLWEQRSQMLRNAATSAGEAQARLSGRIRLRMDIETSSLKFHQSIDKTFPVQTLLPDSESGRSPQEASDEGSNE